MPVFLIIIYKYLWNRKNEFPTYHAKIKSQTYFENTEENTTQIQQYNYLYLIKTFEVNKMLWALNSKTTCWHYNEDKKSMCSKHTTGVTLVLRSVTDIILENLSQKRSVLPATRHHTVELKSKYKSLKINVSNFAYSFT